MKRYRIFIFRIRIKRIFERKFKKKKKKLIEFSSNQSLLADKMKKYLLFRSICLRESLVKY